MNAPRRALALQALAAGLLFAALIGLGVWQTRRLAWKDALLARIDARVNAAPVALPAPAEWARLTPESYEYLRVRSRGRFDLDREALVFSAAPKGAGDEPGYYAVAPFRLTAGGAVLVNRGFVPQSRRDDGLRRREPAGEVEITGVLRAPQSRNAFTPADDPAKGLWYTRDPAAIAGRLGVAGAAPFMVDQETDGAPAAADGLFRAKIDAADIPNNHFSYAATWFTLAFILAVMFAVYARGALKRERVSRGE
jgi:surfeit locus 1 family protein